MAAKTARKAAAQPTLAPIPDFDRLIHEKTRLAIVSALAVNESLSFNDLKKLMATTDGTSYSALSSAKGYSTPVAVNPNRNGCQTTYGNGLTGTSGSAGAGAAQQQVDRANASYAAGSPFVEDQYDRCLELVQGLGELADEGVVERLWNAQPGQAFHGGPRASMPQRRQDVGPEDLGAVVALVE